MIKVLCALLLLCSVAVRAQKVMQLSDQTTTVTFVTKHMLGRLEGTIQGVKGTAQLDSTNLANSFLQLSFATATILQNDYQLGPNLVKADCLDPKEFPEILLASASISKLTGAGQYQFDGTLTVKGISKPVRFPFTAVPNYGGYDFTFTFSLEKKLYNLNCAIKKRFLISVRGYGKNIVPIN